MYNSKILDQNDVTLEELKIKEGSRLILYTGSNNENNNLKRDISKTEINDKNLTEKNSSINFGNNTESEGEVNSSLELSFKNKNQSEIILDRIIEESDDISLPQELKKIGSFMKILTLKDPNKMDVILDNLQKNNQPLLTKIKENKKEFINFCEKPINQDDIDVYMKNRKEARKLLNLDYYNEGKIEILLTEDESTIINKLMEIGKCNIEDAVEAYVVNDKDEKEAKNYLDNKKK